MTVEEKQEEAARHPGSEARARHVRRMRRMRLPYLISVLAVIVAAAVMFAVVWAQGEVTDAHLHIDKTAPVTVPTAPISPSLHEVWHVAESGVIGEPEYHGVVVTYSNHTVTGRDALTGKRRWWYTRSDVTVCAVTQYGGRTVAIFKKDSNCDEITAFSTTTGERQWYRTLTDNGHPQIAATQYSILLITPAQVHSVDPGTGYDRWNFIQPDGCQTTGAALGSQGVLIGQHCSDGDHLIFRDTYEGDDENHPDKPIKWKLNNTSVLPLAGDNVIAGLDPSNDEFVVYNKDKGKVIKRIPVTPPPNVPSTRPLVVDQIGASDAQLIKLGNATYAINASPAGQRWSAQLLGLPTVGDLSQNALASTTLYVPVQGGIGVLDGKTGHITGTFPAATPSPNAGIARLGSGFVVGGSSTTVYQ